MVPSPDDYDKWYLPEGSRIHTEDELSTMIGPDAICALEGMRAGLAALDAAGLVSRSVFFPLDLLFLLQLPIVFPPFFRGASSMSTCGCSLRK